MASSICIVLVCVGVFVGVSAFGAEKDVPLPENSRVVSSLDDIRDAVFAEDHRKFTPQDRSSKRLGIVSQDLMGWGLVYGQDWGARRRWWTQAIFKRRSIVDEGFLNPTPLWAHVRTAERDRFQVLFGVDQTFHLTNNPYWGVILGLGTGISRSRYESTFYSNRCLTEQCTNDEHARTTMVRDEFAFVFWRAGLTFRERRFWGTHGDINIGFVSVLDRWPDRLELKTPDGHVFSRASQASFLIEGLVPF